MSRKLLNNFEPPSPGGLYHHAGGSLPQTLRHLNTLAATDPSCLWMADEGFLYPLAVARYCVIPLSRFLLVQPPSSQETWKLGLEAIQTGLFDVALFRPSKNCQANHWRRLQLAAEKTRTRVFFVGQLGIPHWVLRPSHESFGGGALLQRAANLR